jgi:hypothetical protein
MKFARFLPEIFDDLSGAANDYDEAGGKVLGDRFIQCFYSTIRRVSSTAEAHRLVYGDFRQTLLQPFPYKLYFRIVADDIVFSLLIHAARDPKLVRRLLRQRGN